MSHTICRQFNIKRFVHQTWCIQHCPEVILNLKMAATVHTYMYKTRCS
uniref:Uncharacterized protein n=1 Tax=Anguilla anguilla TaxID=7936 RepID=A0A0E9PFG5_ANGAN